MFNRLYDNPLDEMQAARIERMEQGIRDLDFSTREEFQAEVYSRVNRVLNLGPRMQPLKVVGGEGPAEAGDVSENFAKLNEDALDLARNLVGMEDTAGQLFNLAAATQNSLRQQIREALYTNSSKRWVEPFINKARLKAASAGIDYNAGVATLPLLREDQLKPASVRLGPLSEISGQVSDTAALIDGDSTTLFSAAATCVELIFEFDKAEILNRMRIELDDYEGLQLDELSATADGTYVENLLKNGEVALNGASGKYSGDVFLDFDPVHCKQLRMVIRDRVAAALIALRGISFYSRRYDQSGILVSESIEYPTTLVAFDVDADFDPTLCGLVHQLSFNDGVSYQVIQPGQTIAVSGPYRYRCLFERKKDAFKSVSNPLVPPTLDPQQVADYTVASTNTVNLGGAVMQRTLVLTNVTGPIVLRESPLPGTLRILEGAVITPNSEYTFDGTTLRFGNPKPGVTISYQTSALGSAALEERRDYYSPRLYQVSFERT